MERDYVKIHTGDRIALVTIDNPPVNAFSARVKTRLEEIFDDIGGRADLLVVILTGAGDRAFMAGADIKELVGITAEKARERLARTRAILERIVNCPCPVLCAIEGLALGAGCELALACDIRIASRQARFGLPEVKLGTMPGAGGTQRLARLVGAGKAREMIFSGQLISAEEAWRIGLADRLVGRGEAVNEARKLAEAIVARGPVAVRYAKRAINQGLQLPLQEGLDLEEQLWTELADTEDLREGVSAFIEKRTADFKGK